MILVLLMMNLTMVDAKPAFFIKLCANICEKACRIKDPMRINKVNGYAEIGFVPVKFMECAFDCMGECVNWFKSTGHPGSKFFIKIHFLQMIHVSLHTIFRRKNFRLYNYIFYSAKVLADIYIPRR
jgi:hypothetical protein